MLGDKASLPIHVNMLTEVKLVKLFHSKLGQLLKPFDLNHLLWTAGSVTLDLKEVSNCWTNPKPKKVTMQIAYFKKHNLEQAFILRMSYFWGEKINYQF